MNGFYGSPFADGLERNNMDCFFRSYQCTIFSDKYAIYYSLQDIVIETILCGKNSVQGPLSLKLLFVGLIHQKDNAERN